MLEADPNGRNKVFMDVGCNTGIDAVLHLSRWGVNHDAAEKWSRELRSRVFPGWCHENYALMKWFETKTNLVHKLKFDGDPRVLCVEPMPANVRLLDEVNKVVFGPNSPMEVINAAVSDHNGTGFFPDAGTGEETGILSPSQYPGFASVQVTTVDALLSERNIKKVDVLTIDTEGYDSAVIQGAKETLRYRGVRYLTFEVHQDLSGTPWYNTTLFSVIDFLSEEQFDCYWAGNDGHLRLITGCLEMRQEADVGRIGWSNVACVRRGDKWQGILKNYAVK